MKLSIRNYEWCLVDDKYQQKTLIKARNSFIRLEKGNSVQMREAIIDTAEATGFWLAWLSVAFYKNDFDMFKRLTKRSIFCLFWKNPWVGQMRNWIAIQRTKK